MAAFTQPSESLPAGGATDTVARRRAEQLRGELATQVIVENRPGAGAQLAVSCPARSPFAPETPTHPEQGFPIDITEWFGRFAQAGTPATAVQQIAAVVKEAVAQPDFVKAVADMGMAAHTTAPAAMAAQLRQETEFWRAEVRRIGFTAEP